MTKANNYYVKTYTSGYNNKRQILPSKMYLSFLRYSKLNNLINLRHKLLGEPESCYEGYRGEGTYSVINENAVREKVFLHGIFNSYNV